MLLIHKLTDQVLIGFLFSIYHIINFRECKPTYAKHSLKLFEEINPNDYKGVSTSREGHVHMHFYMKDTFFALIMH